MKSYLLSIAIFGLFLSILMVGNLSADPRPLTGEAHLTPVFVDCPDSVVVGCTYEDFSISVAATHPRSVNAKSIRYHLISPDGYLNPRTGEWRIRLVPRTEPIFVEIAASIGNGPQTAGSENCSFYVTMESPECPDVLLDGTDPGTALLVDISAPVTVPLDITDNYGCLLPPSIRSVNPVPDGDLRLDETGNLLFDARPSDIDNKFTVEFNIGYRSKPCPFVWILDTRTSPPAAPQFVICPSPDQVSRCNNLISHGVRAVDPVDGSMQGVTYALISGPGELVTTHRFGPLVDSIIWRFEPTSDDAGQTFEIEIAASYAGMTTSGDENCRFTVTIPPNAPPEFVTDEQSPCGLQISTGAPVDTTILLQVTDSDSCDVITFSFADGHTNGGYFEKIDDRSAYLHLSYEESASGRHFPFKIAATDGYETAYCEFDVNVDLPDGFEPFAVRIGYSDEVIQGQLTSIDLLLDSALAEIGAFDFLIAYDASALSLNGVTMGPAFGENGCKWEYFAYRYGPNGICGDGACPSGTVRIVGLAEINNGDIHPVCVYPSELPATLASLDFLVTNDRTYECAFAPIQFVWYDCGDNVISSADGVDLHISRKVYDRYSPDEPNLFMDITSPNDIDGYPTCFGSQDIDCFNGSNLPMRSVNFYNGGLVIACVDTIDAPGDLNLNGVSFEVADWVIYSNYFIERLGAFIIDRRLQTITSDINRDGIPLTIEDFVFMTRIINREAYLGQPPPPSSTPATFYQHNGIISVDFPSPDSLGAVFLELEGEFQPVLQVPNMAMKWAADSGHTRILIYDIAVGTKIPAGSLVSNVPGQILIAQAATYAGSKVSSQITDLLPLSVKIDFKSQVYQGQETSLDIIVENAPDGIDGFDFLIGYDAGALSFRYATEGPLFYDQGCGWEYFTYRVENDDRCEGRCPSGKLRFIGIAETNNGDIHPSCSVPDPLPAVLFSIDLLVSTDRSLECEYVPVQFLWKDCADNAVSTPGNSTLGISRRVLEPLNGDFSGLFNSVTSPNHPYGYPTNYGAQDSDCFNLGPGDPPQRIIDFYNGGVWMYCMGWVDARGDVNLNEIPYEIADAALFAEALVACDLLDVFLENVPGQVASTDVNRDGQSLTMADFVVMHRVIYNNSNPAIPIPPVLDSAVFVQIGDHIGVDFESPEPLGAIYLELEGIVNPLLEKRGLQIKHTHCSGVTKILIYGNDSHTGIHSGILVSNVGDGRLTVAKAATFSGAQVGAKIDQLLGAADAPWGLPKQFALHQNYPNPFNPSTRISFDLPRATQVEIEIVNILGKLVYRHTEVYGAGRHSLFWQGRNFSGSPVSSGVYYYKITAGDFTASRKMMLLK